MHVVSCYSDEKIDQHIKMFCATVRNQVQSSQQFVACLFCVSVPYLLQRLLLSVVLSRRTSGQGERL